MGVRTISSESVAVMYDSVTDWAFGPVFYNSHTHEAQERIEAFLEWLGTDPRGMDDGPLEKKYNEWRQQEDEQWKKKEEALAETDE